MSRPTSAASTGSSGRPQPRLGFRVFSFRHRATDRHSFLVGNDQGGVTDVLGHLPVDRDHTTIADLRIPLETVEERGMLKRSPLFAEVLYVMNATQNLHGRPESERRQYRFARIRADEADKPDPYPKKVFTLEEEEKVIVKSCQPVLLIVPLWLIGPRSGVPCPVDFDPEEKAAEDKRAAEEAARVEVAAEAGAGAAASSGGDFGPPSAFPMDVGAAGGDSGRDSALSSDAGFGDAGPRARYPDSSSPSPSPSPESDARADGGGGGAHGGSRGPSPSQFGEDPTLLR